MSTVSASTIINEALADLGVIRPGETVTATVSADCLVRLNQLLASLSTEQLMAQTQKRTVYALQAGVDRYTFGVGATFGTAARPEKLSGWRAYSGSFQSGGKPVTLDELTALSVSGTGKTSALPEAVGADTAYPQMNLGVFPVPGTAPGSIELLYWTALTAFPDLTTAVTFADGWEELLHFNFAMALLPRYGRQGFDAAALAANAQTSKAKIAALNQGNQQAAQ